MIFHRLIGRYRMRMARSTVIGKLFQFINIDFYKCVIWLLALCEIVTYSMFNGCSASILVISIGVFSFRAELQIETTQDYATDSWFFNVFTGLFSLRTSSPFGIFARIHVTAVHEVTRVRGAGKDLLFPTPRGFAVRSRVLSLRAPQLENSESTLRINSLRVRTIL